MFAQGKQKVAEKQWRQKEAKAAKYGFMGGAVSLWGKKVQPVAETSRRFQAKL